MLSIVIPNDSIAGCSLRGQYGQQFSSSVTGSLGPQKGMLQRISYGPIETIITDRYSIGISA